MKKKIAFVLSIFLFISFLWCQNPKKDFPYYYYDSTEKSFNEYVRYFSNDYRKIEDNSEHTILMAKNSNCYYIWTKYKPLVDPEEEEIKNTLKTFQSVAANLDSRLDKKMNTDTSVFFIFTDSNNQLICSARYSDN